RPAESRCPPRSGTLRTSGGSPSARPVPGHARPPRRTSTTARYPCSDPSLLGITDGRAGSMLVPHAGRSRPPGTVLERGIAPAHVALLRQYTVSLVATVAVEVRHLPFVTHPAPPYWWCQGGHGDGPGLSLPTTGPRLRRPSTRAATGR